jgi:hypothetical protein
VNYPRPITRIFEDIVAEVSTALTSTLIANETTVKGQSTITGVHYEHGHLIEIDQTMREKAKGITERYNKYPCVVLVEDIPYTYGRTDYAATVSIRVLILHHTNEAQKSEEREAYNFAPVLRPIYRALVETIGNRREFVVSDPYRMPHVATERKFWGSQFSDTGTDKNRFCDYIDAIEITGLELTLDESFCSHPINQ